MTSLNLLATTTCYRICEHPAATAYLPRSWSYAEAFESVVENGEDGEPEWIMRDNRSPGAQVFTSREEVLRYLNGGAECDGSFARARTVIEIQALRLRDGGGCDWPIVYPEDLSSARIHSVGSFARGGRGRAWEPRWVETLPAPDESTCAIGALA